MRPIFQTETLPRIQYQSALLVLAITCFPSVGYTQGNASHMKYAGEDAGVGEIRTSLLSEDKFLRQYGPDWRLMDGTSIRGRRLSDYTGEPRLPDARGRFLRMANNTASGEDRDEERAIGSLQKSTTKRHQHLYKDAYFTQGVTKPDAKFGYPAIVDYRENRQPLRRGLMSGSHEHGRSGSGFPYYKLNVTGNARCPIYNNHHCWMTITDWEGNPKVNWINASGTVLDRSGQDMAQLVEWNAEKKMADAIDDRESRPVNIAVNYFVRVDCTTSDHCSNK